MTTTNTSPSKRKWLSAATFLLLLAFFLVINAAMVAPYMLSILMGAIIAVLFYPLYGKLLRKKFRPFWASFTITLAITLIVLIPLTIFTLAATNQANSIAQKIYEKSQNLSVDGLVDKLSEMKFVKPFIEDNEQLKAQLIEKSQQGAGGLSKVILRILGNLPDKMLLIVLSLISCFFFLIDGKRFLTFLSGIVPLDADVKNSVFLSFKNTSVSVIWATIAAAAAQGTIMFISFLILGVPGSFLAGGATFIFAWIPVVGSVPVWAAGAIYLYTQDRTGAMIAMILLGLFTGLIDNYIRPLILKGRDELHPLVGLVAIFGGISMFGILGVFVGPVLAALLISLLKIWPTVGKRSGFKFETDTNIQANHIPVE